MENKRIDLDSPRERFFGFWPRRKEAQIFCVINILWVFGACTIWPLLPDCLVWGWFGSFQLFSYVWAGLGAIIWSTYCRKFWSANLQEKLDHAKEAKQGGAVK